MERLLFCHSIVTFSFKSCLHSCVFSVLTFIRIRAELLKVWEADVTVLLSVLSNVAVALASPHLRPLRCVHWTRLHLIRPLGWGRQCTRRRHFSSGGSWVRDDLCEQSRSSCRATRARVSSSSNRGVCADTWRGYGRWRQRRTATTRS